MKPFDLYITFVRQRHLAWANRQVGNPEPWCSDPIIQTRKFTNIFRILDPGTQFVLTDLAEDGLPDDIVMRCFLYRHTNQPGAWRAYKKQYGTYPTLQDLDRLENFWWVYTGEGGRVFNGAYNIYPQSTVKGTSKVESVIDLTRRLFLKGDLVDVITWASTMEFRFEALRRNRGVGDFMAMQILTDIGYLVEQDENEFIAPGPGAVRGAKLIYPELKPMDTIYELRDVWLTLGDIFIPLPDGTRRYPSLMDVQNTLCEFSKYHRYLDKTATKPYQPAHPGPQPEPVYPSHWMST